MSVNQMKVAEVLLKNCPQLVTSVESVNKLILRDVIDFETGSNLINKIETAAAKSTESEDTIPADFSTGISFPSVNDSVVFNTVMELIPGEERESFMKKFDELNLQFETAFKKRKEDIIRVVSSVVEINETDSQVASEIMNTLKNEKFLLIRK